MAIMGSVTTLRGWTKVEGRLGDLAEFFKVFADPTRLRILRCLMGQELCVHEISDAVGMGQSAVSHQLRVLKHAHLVRHRRAGKEARYTLSDHHVRAILEQGLVHVSEAPGGGS
jgi:DNA-binding transcriptional ArsR family regulator